MTKHTKSYLIARTRNVSYLNLKYQKSVTISCDWSIVALVTDRAWCERHITDKRIQITTRNTYSKNIKNYTTLERSVASYRGPKGHPPLRSNLRPRLFSLKLKLSQTSRVRGQMQKKSILTLRCLLYHFHKNLSEVCCIPDIDSSLVVVS